MMKSIRFDPYDVIRPVVGFPLKPRFSLLDGEKSCNFTRKDLQVVWFVGHREVGKSISYIPTRADLIDAHNLKCVVTIIDRESMKTIVGERLYEELIDPHHIRRTLQSSSLGQYDFTVICYNILANCYLIRDCGYRKCPPRAREWPFRLTLVSQDIKTYKPDFICLQEVEKNRFDFCMGGELKRAYDFKYLEKTSCRGPTEGLCIASKRETTKVIDYEEVLFEKEAVKTFDGFKDTINLCKRHHVAQLMRLEIHQKEICLVNVHLTVDVHTEVKLFQILHLMDAIHNFLCGADIPIVLCGDFNMTPSSNFYDFMVNQVAPLPAFSKVSVQVAFEAKMNCFKEMVSEKKLKHNLSSLGSAYGSCKKSSEDWTKELYKFLDNNLKEPAFTQLKHEFHKLGTITLHELGPRFLNTLDYIFFSEKNLKCNGLLELMEKTEVHINQGIPNSSHPSDHVLLLARFSFL